MEREGPVRALEGGGPLRVEDCVSHCRHRECVSVSLPKPGGGVGAETGLGALTTCTAEAVDGGHPQVSRARVEDDLELLRGRSNTDGANVIQLPGPGKGV